MLTVAEIAANLAAVRDQIASSAKRASRDPSAIKLIAVSKTFPPEYITAAYECGHRDFGENRVQEFQQKLPKLHLPAAVFHLIGHLQTNKVSQAMSFDCIQTVDSERLARKLNEAAIQRGKIMPVMIEVKLSTEESKSGVSDHETAPLARLIESLDHLELQGLMTIPPFTSDPEGARPYFRRLRDVRDQLRAGGVSGMEELSMGMTRDFTIAIEEGATMVRMGTAVFGPRTKQSEPRP
ncbi:MAG: YggS family pyridoxal phosphate-dependent enzyme [Acidobacteria bacterium]|nr:YggS family pyridoxal phosphate-dependent enzyme [Acidobacteriota bacterium]